MALAARTVCDIDSGAGFVAFFMEEAPQQSSVPRSADSHCVACLSSSGTAVQPVVARVLKYNVIATTCKISHLFERAFHLGRRCEQILVLSPLTGSIPFHRDITPFAHTSQFRGHRKYIKLLLRLCDAAAEPKGRIRTFTAAS
jgi:hypothetical protein